MAPGKSYRVKFYSGLHLFFQSFLVLLLLSVMVIWAMLLLTVAQNDNPISLVFFARNSSLIALPDSNQTKANTSNSLLQINTVPSRVLRFTNLAIPLVFAFIGLLAVILSDIYWSAVSGIILFVFWILDHQRFPTLFGWTATNSSEILIVIGHALHLFTWSFLLLYGGLLVLLWRLKQHKLTRALPRRPQLSPVYCQYGTNYCSYLSPGQSPANLADAPPYYDTFPPPPTFETIQIRSTRAASNAN